MLQSYTTNYNKPSKDEISRRLSKVHEFMNKNKLDFLIVRATDSYLNEYVPLLESQRVYLSGFTGSVGDLIVTKAKAYIIVDGRYYTQADLETHSEFVEVIRLPFGEDMEKYMVSMLVDIIKKSNIKNCSVGFEPNKISVDNHKYLEKELSKVNSNMNPVAFNFLDADIKKSDGSSLMPIPENITGKSISNKLMELRSKLTEKNIDVFIISPLDELSYVTNLRGYDIAYNSTYKGIGILTQTSFDVFMEVSNIKNEIKNLYPDVCSFHLLEEFDQVVNEISKRLKSKSIKIGYDKSSTTFWTLSKLKQFFKKNSEFIEADSPIIGMKSIKTPEEIRHFKDAFSKSDKVIIESILWLNESINSGKKVSEEDFRNKVEENFDKSGALALSFQIISAVGENSAIIHYSQPDPNRIIKKGELVLIDTGAYYEGGLATDLTRTFLAGGDPNDATPKMKLIYTSVLKGMIQGIKARFPKGTKGIQIDSIARHPIWSAGFDYKHGTGHGVGINVHEMPPRLNIVSGMVLEENMIFSVEPGIYLEGFGGVRIENLATVVKDKENEDWLRIIPLTFCPLDNVLIDQNLLNKDEIEWIEMFKRKEII